MSVTGVQTPWGTQQNQSQVPLAGSTGQVDKQEFLMLLVAQLRNQDPSKPMEDREFISQLATFNTLEQMQQMNATLSSVSEMTVLGQLAGFVGKHVGAIHQGVTVEGIVAGVTLVDGTPRLLVGDQQVDIHSVFEISSAEPPAPPEPAPTTPVQEQPPAATQPEPTPTTPQPVG